MSEEFLQKLQEKIKKEQEFLEQVLQKIKEYYFVKNEALTISKLAKELKITPYKLQKYIAILEQEEQIKILKFGRAFIIVPREP